MSIEDDLVEEYKKKFIATPNIHLVVGGEEYTFNDIAMNIAERTELGKKIVLIHTNYERFREEGGFNAIG